MEIFGGSVILLGVMILILKSISPSIKHAFNKKTFQKYIDFIHLCRSNKNTTRRIVKEKDHYCLEIFLNDKWEKVIFYVYPFDREDKFLTQLTITQKIWFDTKDELFTYEKQLDKIINNTDFHIDKYCLMCVLYYDVGSYEHLGTINTMSVNYIEYVNVTGLNDPHTDRCYYSIWYKSNLESWGIL